MSRKSLALVLCIAIVLGLVGMTTPTKAQTVTEVKMVYWTGPESLAMADVIDAYNRDQGKKDGVQVQMVLFGREGFWERQETLMAAKSAEVDVFYTASYYVGRQEAALEPISNFVKTLGKDSIFIPSTLESLSYKGTLYGIPLDVGLHFMYYRNDLIDKLLSDAAWQAKYKEISKAKMGKEMSPKPINQWVWDDYMAAALFFTKSINPDSPTEYGTVLQAKNLVYNVMIWNDVLWSMGGGWFDKSGAFTFDTPEFKAAAKFYADILKAGASPAASTSYEYGEANQAFMTGQAAFYMQWSAAFNEINGSGSQTAGKVGIAPIPGPKPSTHVHSLGVALSKYSKNKDAAVKWLTYLTTKPAMEAYAKAGGIPPVADVLNGMASKRPEFTPLAEHLAKYAFVETTAPETFAILDVLAKNLSAVWAGQMDVDKAAAEAQKAATALIKK
ncbi:MAG: sugar ABC transporter substrate-binding protein [Anaerolineae bacterium]|nr:sugar ABC transporter substrate-binding protein [Anaerolineae bacterium]